MNSEQPIGTWRSYKTFQAMGGVKVHSQTSYSEIGFTAQDEFYIKSFSLFTKMQVFEKQDWFIQAMGKRRFLYLSGKKTLEIITLEKDVAVLQESVSGDKTFFASLPLWKNALHPLKEMDENVYITLWSQSLIKLVRCE